MPYAGGKQRLAARIAGLLPSHDHYIEPFAGALSVLLAKPRVELETVNDLNGDLMVFWRVLRDHAGDLARVCALTPHARAELVAARDLDCADLERARRVWVQLTQGRGGRLGVSTGWRFVHGANRMSLARYLTGYVDRIAAVAERLHGVTLECRDALEIIDCYERPGAVFDLDPPYRLSTRHSHQYALEYTDADHEALLARIATTPAAVAISGYDNDLYREHLNGWRHIELPATAMTGESRTESLWLNYSPDETLFGEPTRTGARSASCGRTATEIAASNPDSAGGRR